MTATPSRCRVPAGGCTANVTLPAAPRSISGTLTFDQPAAKETRIRIFSYDNNSRVGSHGSSLTVPQGATSAEFSLGVGEGSYLLQFTNEDVGDYAFYGIHGDVTKEYQQRMVLSTLDGSVSGLHIDGSKLMGDSAEFNQVKVTVNLPAALSEERGYEVSLYNTEQGSQEDNRIVYAEPGERFLEATLSIAEGQSFLVGYADVTDFDTLYSESTGIRYAAEDGITALRSQATVFTSGVDTEITITEPPCHTVTGALTRGGTSLPSLQPMSWRSLTTARSSLPEPCSPRIRPASPIPSMCPRATRGRTSHSAPAGPWVTAAQSPTPPCPPGRAIPCPATSRQT